MSESLYDVLGVDPDADEDDLRQAYREKAREHHPDRTDDDDARRRFTLVNKAHEVLSDPAERSAYDRLGHENYVATRGSSIPPLNPDDDPGGESAGSSDPRSTGESGGTDAGDRSERSPHQAGGDAGAGDRADTGAPGDSRPSGSASEERSEDDGSRSAATSDAGSTAGASRDATGSSMAGRTAGGQTAASTDAAEPGATEEERATARKRRRGLRRAYAAVVAAALVYGVGLAGYAGTAAEALRNRMLELTTGSVAAAAGPSPLPPVAAFLEAAASGATAGSPGAAAGLGVAVGGVALPAALIVTVARYGRGTAWLYALPSLLPAAVLAGAAVLGPPALWVELIGLALAPVAATTAFCVDVGRYLLATRGQRTR